MTTRMNPWPAEVEARSAGLLGQLPEWLGHLQPGQLLARLLEWLLEPWRVLWLSQAAWTMRLPREIGG